MRTSQIRKMIEVARAEEQRTNNLVHAIDELARSRGAQPSDAQINETTGFVTQYIEHAPALLDQIAAAAHSAEVLNEVLPLLETAEDYFFAPFEVIPDQLGLLGLVDDAYLTQSMLQAISDHYRAQTGQPLLSTDLTRANHFVRSLIGEPGATILDDAVLGVMQGPLQPDVAGLPTVGGGFDVSGPDPIWGYATVDQIVDVQMGAMGIV